MSLGRKLFLAVVLAAVLFVCGRGLYRALASDQTKIRWRIEEMVEGFNACRTGVVLDGFAKDFHDRASGAVREDVHAALVQLFFERVDPRTHEFTLHAELAADELAIAVEPAQPPRATVQIHVVIREGTGDVANTYWDAHVAGRLEKRDDGWQWVETTDVNHRDRAR